MQRAFITTMAFLFLSTITLAGNAGGDKKKDAEGFPPVERGPEHKVLGTLVGSWDAKVKFYFPDPTKPSESKGTMTRKLILGGNFLHESFQGEFVGKKFAGVALIGFDVNKKIFETVWCDSMSTSMTLSKGTYHPEKKTLISVGEEFEPDSKKKVKTRDVLRIVGPDEQSLEMYRQPEGEEKEFKIMEIVFTRKKGDKQ